MNDFSNIPEFDPLSGINPSLDVSDLLFSEEEREESSQEVIKLSGPQMEFFALENRHPLFVAGFGSGKSLTLALCAVRDLINYPGANVAVYAPTFDLLFMIIVPYLSEMFETGGYEYKYNGGHHYFQVKGFGKIYCRSLDNPSRIVGYETFRAHCDELDTLKLEKAENAWNKVIARNRQKVYVLNDKGKKIQKKDENGEFLFDPVTGTPVYEMHMNRVSAYTTPEGWNFAWKRWVKEKKEDDGYEFVKASTYSNQHNLPDDYIPNLKKSYPPELAEAYINGEFTNLTSGRVYRNFDRKLNASTETVQRNDLLHVGMDFNIEHGAATICVDRKNKETGELEAHQVDEIYDSYDTDDTIRILKERYPNNKIIVYPDSTGRKRHSGGTGVNTKGVPTSTDLYKIRQEFEVVVDTRNPPIKDRITAWNAMILNGEGVRRFFINLDKCPRTLETLEQQCYDNNGMPDKSSGLDHLGDAGGYHIHKRFPLIQFKSGFVPLGRGR